MAKSSCYELDFAYEMPFWVSSDILLYVRSVYIQLDENCIITVRTFTWTIQVHIASFLFTSSSFFGLYANFTFIYRIQSKTVDNYLIHVFWMLCLPGSSLHGVRISPLRCTIHQIKNIPKFGNLFLLLLLFLFKFMLDILHGRGC